VHRSHYYQPVVKEFESSEGRLVSHKMAESQFLRFNYTRACIIRDMRARGIPAASIGRMYGFSRQRVHQIVEKVNKYDALYGIIGD
jgi:hypothetical protein